MTGYVFVTSSGTSQSTYIHIFHLLLWCAASSELAPQSSSNSNQYHLKVLNSYTIHEKQSKRTRKKQSWKWLVAKNVSHELVKRGNPYIWVDQRPHCCRSAADLNKSHNPKGIHHPHETINGCTWKSYSQQWPLPSPLFTKQHPMFSKYRSMFLPLMRSENQWRQHATFSVPPDESNQQNAHSEISSTNMPCFLVPDELGQQNVHSEICCSSTVNSQTGISTNHFNDPYAQEIYSTPTSLFLGVPASMGTVLI